MPSFLGGFFVFLKKCPKEREKASPGPLSTGLQEGVKAVKVK